MNILLSEYTNIMAEDSEIPEPEVPEKDEYPLWKQPTHAGDAYYNGDKMTYTDGFKYECIAPEGYAVTYGPDALPQYWRKVE